MAFVLARSHLRKKIPGDVPDDIIEATPQELEAFESRAKALMEKKGLLKLRESD